MLFMAVLGLAAARASFWVVASEGCSQRRVASLPCVASLAAEHGP